MIVQTMLGRSFNKLEPVTLNKTAQTNGSGKTDEALASNYSLLPTGTLISHACIALLHVSQLWSVFSRLERVHFFSLATTPSLQLHLL